MRGLLVMLGGVAPDRQEALWRAPAGEEAQEVLSVAGIIAGCDREIEIDSEEELELQRVELRKPDTADLCPAAYEINRRSGSNKSLGILFCIYMYIYAGLSAS